MTFLNDNLKKEIDEFADLIVNNKPVKTVIKVSEVMELVYKIYSADEDGLINKWTNKKTYKIKFTLFICKNYFKYLNEVLNSIRMILMH